ncbi:MAG: OmpA family protein [Balneolaceae bacterium]|nr:OmpA family protein [Balneolaceae bacterium]
MKKDWLILLGTMILTSGLADVSAQNFKGAFLGSPGLQVSVTQGNTDLRDDELNYLFRLYNYQAFDTYSFGELSISSGVLAGTSYKNRITPVEYRWGQLLSRYGMPEPTIFGKKSSFYGYAGLGLLYNQPIKVQAPNDPLVPDQGNSLATSSFWDFDGGLAPFIPVGAGLKIPVDIQTSLDLSIGYNQAINALKFTSQEVPEGYWVFSVGLNLKRKTPKKPVYTIPLPEKIKKMEIAPPTTRIKIVTPKPVDLSSLLNTQVESKTINFDVFSSQIKEADYHIIEEVALVMKLNYDAGIEVIGHADSTGSDAINDMISESRARAVWLALIEEGADPEQSYYNWYADLRPITAKRTPEERARNRRVEFEIQEQSKTNIQDIEGSGIRQKIEIGSPIAHQIEFEGLNFEDAEDVKKDLITLGSYLHKNKKVNLFIASMGRAGATEGFQQELSKARSEKIKAGLIILGIEPSRIHAFNPYKEELNEGYKKLFQETTQSVLLIPQQ